MPRATYLALACLTLFLVLFPLSVGKPGQPPSMKADEPAYYLMALSLAHDGDLLCETKDLRRLFDEYPFGTVHNLILMTDDSWNTVYFGKPYIYSLLAAPAAAIAGANGLVAFNMALLMAMVWMGTLYLERFNPRPVAALFSAGFFLLSSGFSYVFWLHPELLNMASVAACLFFAFHRREADEREPSGLKDKLLSPLWRVGWSAAALTPAIYNKPMLAAFALPAVWAAWRRVGMRGVVVCALAAALALGAIAGVSFGLTGHPSAYLGVERTGPRVADPEVMPVRVIDKERPPEALIKNSWWWIFRIPDFDPGELFASIREFFVGRHTGLVLYMPFAVLAFILFLLHGRHSRARWLNVAALAAVALFFLLWIPFNWHGGGGFIGNRYFINAYPAFLFLVTRIHPVSTIAAAYAAAGFVLGPLLFTPFGAPVPNPTLQAHVRGAPFRYFPLEETIKRKIPGYRDEEQRGVWFLGRNDIFKRRGTELWVHGAVPTELWVRSVDPLPSMVFRVRTEAANNEIAIKGPGTREVVVFEDAKTREEKVRTVTLTPSGPSSLRDQKGVPIHTYKLVVHPRTGRTPRNSQGGRTDSFYLGAALSFQGTTEQAEGRGPYEISWRRCDAPDEMTIDRPITVPVGIENSGGSPWSPKEPTPVRVSYHWVDEEGEVAVWDGARTPLPGILEPGAGVDLEARVRPPESPGRYTLVFDLVRERVGWFAARNGGQTCRREVEILPPS